MLDFNLSRLGMVSLTADYDGRDNHAQLLGSANSLFNNALARGYFFGIRSLLLRRSRRLLDLNRLPASRVTARRYGGLQVVSLERIRGTLGRVHDFDIHFHPLSPRLRDRWQSVAMARLQDIGLPVVSLIQVGEPYFVQDGHHRISVARALGEEAIDAEVTIWELGTLLPHAECRAQAVLSEAYPGW